MPCYILDYNSGTIHARSHAHVRPHMLHASVRHVPYMTLMQTFHMTLVAAGMQTFSYETHVCKCHRSFLCTPYAASSPLWHTAVSSNPVRRPAFLFKHTSTSAVPLLLPWTCLSPPSNINYAAPHYHENPHECKLP